MLRRTISDTKVFLLKFGIFLAKITIVVILNTLIPPIHAVIAGALVFATSKMVRNSFKGERLRYLLIFVGDCGGDLAFGGLIRELLTSKVKRNIVKYLKVFSKVLLGLLLGVLKSGSRGNFRSRRASAEIMISVFSLLIYSLKYLVELLIG